MPFFVVLSFVLGLCDVLVLLHAPRRGPGLLEVQAARMLGADRGVRQEPLERLPLAGGARRDVAGTNQLLEFMAAAGAAILVDRHTGDGTRMPRAVQLAGRGQLLVACYGRVQL